MSDDPVISLKKEVDALKKKLGIATIIGLALGGGGLFGLIKWVTTDRQLTVVETRFRTVETEVLKLETLTTIYEQEKEKLNTAEIQNASQEMIDEMKIRIEGLEIEIRDIEEDLKSAFTETQAAEKT